MPMPCCLCSRQRPAYEKPPRVSEPFPSNLPSFQVPLYVNIPLIQVPLYEMNTAHHWHHIQQRSNLLRQANRHATLQCTRQCNRQSTASVRPERQELN